MAGWRDKFLKRETFFTPFSRKTDRHKLLNKFSVRGTVHSDLYIESRKEKTNRTKF
jgi:hypothetical protein